MTSSIGAQEWERVLELYTNSRNVNNFMNEISQLPLTVELVNVIGT